LWGDIKDTCWQRDQRKPLQASHRWTSRSGLAPDARNGAKVFRPGNARFESVPPELEWNMKLVADGVRGRIKATTHMLPR
jgi:hypothetical protein